MQALFNSVFGSQVAQTGVFYSVRKSCCEDFTFYCNPPLVCIFYSICASCINFLVHPPEGTATKRKVESPIGGDDDDSNDDVDSGAVAKTLQSKMSFYVLDRIYCLLILGHYRFNMR